MSLIFERGDFFSQRANRDASQFRAGHVYGLSFYLERRGKMVYRLTHCRCTYEWHDNACRKRVEDVSLKIEKIGDIFLGMLIRILVYIKLSH